MAAPVLAKLVGVKVDNANVGEYVIVRNLTRGGQLTGQLKGTDRSIIFNPAPNLAWQNGDEVQGEIRGRLAGSKKETIQSGRATIKITNAAGDSGTPGVSL